MLNGNDDTTETPMIHHQVTITTDTGTRRLEFRTRNALAETLGYYGVSQKARWSYEGTFAPTARAVYVVTWGPVAADAAPVPAPRTPAPARQATAPAPRPTRPDAKVTAGIYRVGDAVYAVKPNREGSRVYAKRLVEIGGVRITDAGTFVNVDFQYEAGAIFKIRPEHRLSGDEAAQLAVRYGRCIMCGRGLRNGVSVQRAIGPVCWGKIA